MDIFQSIESLSEVMLLVVLERSGRFVFAIFRDPRYSSDVPKLT